MKCFDGLPCFDNFGGFGLIDGNCILIEILNPQNILRPFSVATLLNHDFDFTVDN